MSRLLPLPKGYCEPLKTQGARWKNFYRSQDKGVGNRFHAKCGFCLCDVDGRPEKLHNHALCCTSWPILDRTLYLQNATKEIAGSVEKKRPVEKSSVSESDQHKHPRQEVIVSSSSTKQQSMLSWLSKPISSQKKNDIHDLLLKAIIFGGIPFSIGDNIFFKQFVHALSSSYNVPSSETLRGRVLTEMFSKHLQKKLLYLPSFTNYTICFDGWADVSGNSIYAFMVLKEEIEDVLDIVDLSDVRHTALELKEQLLSNLLRNGAMVYNVLACVTDSPSNMVKLRNDLRVAHPNVIHIRCCLHGFNLLDRDVAGFPEVTKVCKLNQKLVNYFTSSHIWRRALKKWQEEKKIPHFLSTFCETRWYSLSRVCLGVAAYEDGFRHCLELSRTPGYPQITNVDVRNTILNRHHFADNECLVQALKPIVDVIGKLERRTTTLEDVLGSFITVYHNARTTHYAIRGLKDHILCAIGKRVREFEDPIYFVALFLHPARKSMAMSRMMTGEKIIHFTLEIAKSWHYCKREVTLLCKELINYMNGDAPFDELKDTNTHSARDFWEKFCGGSPLLRRFATKVFAIVPHSGPCERLFSTLGLLKTKPRNRLEVERFNMLAQIKCDLASEIRKEKTTCAASNSTMDGLSMSDFDAPIGDEVGNDLLNEEIDDVHFDYAFDDIRLMESYFDFDAFERENTSFTLGSGVDGNVDAPRRDDGEWNIFEIMRECF